MTINDLLEKLSQTPDAVEFVEVQTCIDGHFEFVPTAFSNGDTVNAAGQNNGSCKLFAFAKLQDLTQADTLACFGQYYRDVLATPEGYDHQNIRNFMRSGWDGIRFEGQALTPKPRD